MSTAGADPEADARLGGYLQAYMYIKAIEFEDLQEVS